MAKKSAVRTLVEMICTNPDCQPYSYHTEKNRRNTPDGEKLVTRITEGMTEYTYKGIVGYGMSEYLDQVIDDKPIGP